MKLIFCLIYTGTLAGQVITTVAGTDWSFPATPRAAVNSPLGSVQGMAIDSAGNVYIADGANNLVEQVKPDGTLTVVAGNGLAGFSGDGGPATSAELNGPAGVAVDTAGNLYIADEYNSRLRKVATDGAISTLTSALGDPSCVAVDAAGNVYVGDDYLVEVLKVSPGGVVTVVAGYGASSGIGIPLGIAIDSNNNLYIASNDSRLYKLTPAGQLTVVAGDGSIFPQGNGVPATTVAVRPFGVAADTQGNIYIADVDPENSIRKVTPEGIITTIAGNGVAGFAGDGGPAVQAELNSPTGIEIDSAGNIYVADSNHLRIRTFKEGGFINTFAGNGNFSSSGDGGLATSATMNSPAGVVCDQSGNIYVAESNRIRKISAGAINTFAGIGLPTYSGDGGPAVLAGLNSPLSLALDTNANVYFIDFENDVIRKINSDGIISTVAGQGTNGLVGGQLVADGAPATSGLLEYPTALTVDTAGNFYFSDGGYAASGPQFEVRKVNPSGITSTLIGTDAQLSGPEGMVFDAGGNLYIADTDNNRIVEYSGGQITTRAGNGTRGNSGDGGPATSAAISNPDTVAVDLTGQLYISGNRNGDLVDTSYQNNAVRKVAADGTITTLAGSAGVPGFSGDGGLAQNALLNEPSSIALDAAGNLYIADTGNNRIRKVLANPPFFANLPSSCTLTLSAPSGGKPATGSLVVAASISETDLTPVPGMSYTVQIGSTASWLSVSPQNGNTPGLITVTADPSSLPPGNYVGMVTFGIPYANPPARTLTVQFTVAQPIAASVGVDHDHLSFTYAQNSAPRSQPVTVENLGGGTLNISTAIALDSGLPVNWLSVDPPQGTVTPVVPLVIHFQASPSGLTPGTYTAHVTISGLDSRGNPVPPQIVVVTITITTNPSILLLSQTGLTISSAPQLQNVVLPPGIQNGGIVAPQTFAVMNLGTGAVTWQAQTSVLGNGVPNWLVANAPDGGTQGSSDASTPDTVPLVTVGVDLNVLSQLSPDTYYGLVKVISAGAANTPQVVVVAMQVLPPAASLAPVVQPGSLVFSREAGNSSPSSQNLYLYDPTGTNKSFRSVKATMDGGNWFVTLPEDGTISPLQPAKITVQPIVDNLAPGTYYGTLALQFSDGNATSIGITFVVTPPSNSPALRGGTRTSTTPRDDSSGSSCTPTQLLPSLISLGTGFNLPAGFPQGLVAQVVDDCGVPHQTGTVYVEFSNGDPKVKLSSVSGGYWQGTWQTHAQTLQVSLTVTASDSGIQPGQSVVNGGLGGAEPPPIVADNGVVSTASLASVPFSPGDLITIQGQGLADGTLSAPNGTQSSLADTVVTVGDQVLPLFYASDGSVNAMVSYLINENTNQQLLVQRGLTYATPVYIDVASAQPAVLTNAQQPMIVDVNGNLIGPQNPAHAGDTITIYCAGLGSVNPPVADGTITPPSGQSVVNNSVTVLIGGQSVAGPVATLAPGLVAAYQIIVTAPQGAGTGDQIPVVIGEAGQTSPTVMTSLQ